MSEADLTSHHIEGFTKPGRLGISLPLFSHIHENLWVGGRPEGEVPERFQFIINCIGNDDDPPYIIHPHQIYTRIPLIDKLDPALMPTAEILWHLRVYIAGCLDIGSTLVHCKGGINRSALMAALALMTTGMSAKTAIALLREKRHEALLSNETFYDYLMGLRWEL